MKEFFKDIFKDKNSEKNNLQLKIKMTYSRAPRRSHFRI